MPHTAKLFRMAAVKPFACRRTFVFPARKFTYVAIPTTGNVILSRRPESWQDFFELIDSLDIPEDFLSNRRDTPPQKRKA